MAKKSSIIYQNTHRKNQNFNTITVGTVVDTNDPQQMGRIRVMCPALADEESAPVTDIPWATYVSPFGGITKCINRGVDSQYALSDGPVSYGMFTIPKIGAQAIVACLDGSTEYRIWLGCIYGQHLVHTMPMGRFLDQNSGPVTSTEQPIEPLTTNLKEALGDPTSSFEYRTRAAENQAGRVRSAILNKIVSGRPDDISPQNRKGYHLNRILNTRNLGKSEDNLDPQVYSITTPGLHAILMDDGIRNERIRIKTTSGHQIIFDDTNERIYINTAKGKNWIELDQNGNIDMFSERRISIHGAKDINFTTDEAFRVDAKKGIHLNNLGEEGDIRLTTAGNIHLKSNFDTRIQSTKTNVHLKAEAFLFLRSKSHTHHNVGGSYVLNAQSNIEMETTASFKAKSSSELCLYSSGSNVRIDANPNVYLNSGSNCAVDITNAIIATDSLFAYATNRVPMKEPWGRVMSVNTDKDNATNTNLNLELAYDSEDVGKLELGVSIPRNSFWRR